MHLKLSAVKHRPGGRNDSRSPPKPRRSDASESGEVWFYYMDLCACQKGLCEKTCRLCWNNIAAHVSMSLFYSLQRWGGGCKSWVCVTVCFCTSYVCDGGHVAVSWALKDSTALHFRGGEGCQRVNSRFCPAATSVSQTESAVLFRLPPFSFNDSSHSFVLTSLLSLFPSHLCLQWIMLVVGRGVRYISSAILS